MRDRTADEMQEAADDLKTLISRCVSGESDAITSFVHRFERAVFGLCLRMLRDRQEAEDAAQETFVRATRNLHKWDDTRPLLPWLQTIAANRCRTMLGKRTRRPSTAQSLPEQVDRSNTCDDDVEEVDRALEQLPERWRSVIVMHYRGGLNCGEIAETMGCAEGTVKTWLFRARKQLADELRGRGFTEETSQ